MTVNPRELQADLFWLSSRAPASADIAVVVTRYFGGIRLGTGGLVRAYTAATQEVLQRVPRQIYREMCRARFRASYDLYETCCKAVVELGGELEGEDFANVVTVTIAMARGDLDAMSRSIRDATKGEVDLVEV